MAESCQGAVRMITSTSNQQIKNLLQLQKKSKVRKEQGIFVVEGVRMFREAPADWIIKTYVSQEFLKKEEASVLKGREYEIVEDRVFKTMSDTMSPQGILAVVKQPSNSLETLLDAPAPFFMVLENIQDPGNLGTILRTAEGAGVTGILMSRDTVDIFNPKTIRSTMGSVYRVPFLYVEDICETVRELKNKGICTYAAHLKGTGSYDEQDYTKGTAFLIGNEGNGLTDQLADLADTYIRIPMYGQLESLNAAVASAVLMYETQRQRRKNGK